MDAITDLAWLNEAALVAAGAAPFVANVARKAIKTLRLLVKAGRAALDATDEVVDDIADVWDGDWPPIPGMGD